MSERLPQGEELPESSKGIKEELLETLIQEDQPDYPWNPGEPEAEAYFAQLEQEFSLLDDLDAEEIDTKAATFYAKLHQHWDATNGHKPDED